MKIKVIFLQAKPTNTKASSHRDIKRNKITYISTQSHRKNIILLMKNHLTDRNLLHKAFHVLIFIFIRDACLPKDNIKT